MDYMVVIGMLAAAAVLLLILAVWLGWPGRWILGWLQGSAVLILLTSAGLLALIAADLPYWSKASLADEQVLIAHVGIDKPVTNPSNRLLTLSLPGQSINRTSPDLQGDFAHLGFQVLRWRGPLHGLGMSYRPLYVRTGLDNLSTSAHHAVSEAHHPWDDREQGWQDAWNLLQKPLWRSLLAPLVQADTLELGYIPLTTESALFSVSLQKNRLTLLPVNDNARQAVAF